MMRRGLAVFIGLAVLSLSDAAFADDAAVVEPDGYRTGDYRAPTPKTLAGARVVSTSQAHALWTAKTAVFVDVMPRPPRPAGLPAGTIWREKLRPNIPGSIWLPDTGYGVLAATTDDYFRIGLEQATRGARGATLVFYCLKDCWMSWNAARRAVALGYLDVVWYPDGTDGWKDAGLPFEDGRPMSRPGD
jgi:PQQ-dependent catabolism-associated CXXCW motif protein